MCEQHDRYPVVLFRFIDWPRSSIVFETVRHTEDFGILKLNNLSLVGIGKTCGDQLFDDGGGFVTAVGLGFWSRMKRDRFVRHNSAR